MFFNKNKGEPVLAPMNGRVVAIGDIDEPIFSGKAVGDGVAIIPAEGTVVSPVDGTVSFISDQHHAYGILSNDGIEILIHVGIDTVKLNGKGFTALVKKGDQVKAGDQICKVDLDFLHQEHYDTTTPCVITSMSMDKIKRLILRTGQAAAGSTVCIRYIKA